MERTIEDGFYWAKHKFQLSDTNDGANTIVRVWTGLCDGKKYVDFCGSVAEYDPSEFCLGSKIEPECEICCGGCKYFLHEDAYGKGWCSENDRESECSWACERFEELIVVDGQGPQSNELTTGCDR